jgi:hypothetical protein
MKNELMTSTAIIDGFDADAQDPTVSPIRGNNLKFKDGDYFSFAEQVDVSGKSYAAIDKLQGWQKLEHDCPPEYLMRKPGEPRPPQPHVDEQDWPLNFNNVPEHPWKWTTYLRLLDTETGELSTFWTNTVGGNIAIGELGDQIAFMRQMRPNAIPVIALAARDMPTRYGGTTRPYFRIVGWRERSDAGAAAALTGPEQQSSATQLQLDEFAAEKPPASKSSEKAAEPATAKKKTTKRGVTRIDAPKLTPVEEPSSEEMLNDEIDF